MANNMINSLNFDNNIYTFTLPYGICNTSAGTTAKVVDVDNFSLEIGARVLVKFTTTNTVASPTLNVESTGAKPIMYRGAAIDKSYLSSGRVYDFVYDGTNWELIGDINVNTNTMNTAGATDTAEKIFLIGAKSQAANPQTYSHDTAYVGTDGCLYSNGKKVSVEGHGTHVDYGTTASDLASASSPGTANTVSRSDHKHKFPTLANLGVNSSATELNYVKGVTSSVQNQLNAITQSLNAKQPAGSYVVKDQTGVQCIQGGIVLGSNNTADLSGIGAGRIMMTGNTNPLIGVQATDANGTKKTPYFIQSVAGDDKLYIGPTSTKALSFDDEGNMASPSNLSIGGAISEGGTSLTNKYAPKVHVHSITANASDDDVIVLTGKGGNNEVSYTASHATSGVNAGTYKSVTVNAKGHVTAGSNPTTLSGFGITDSYTKTEIDDKFEEIEWFKTGTSISSGSDLDSFTNVGKYSAGSEAIAKSLINCPTKTNFCMFVLVRTSGSSKTQLILDLNGDIYMRSCSSNGEWRAWKEYVNQTQLTNSMSETLASANGYTDDEIAKLVGEAPELLNTLEELAAALQDNPEVIDTILQTLTNKVDKVAGKGLSTEDYTSAEKTKLGTIEANAEANQNAFSSVFVNKQEYGAPNVESSLEFIKGTGIDISAVGSGRDGDIGITIANTGATGVKGNAETNYRTGNVNITPANIGLGKVNNTSDADKPVSTAQQVAIDKAKQEAIHEAVEESKVFYVYLDGEDYDNLSASHSFEEIVAAIVAGKNVKVALKNVALNLVTVVLDEVIMFGEGLGPEAVIAFVTPDNIWTIYTMNLNETVDNNRIYMEELFNTLSTNTAQKLQTKIEANKLNEITMYKIEANDNLYYIPSNKRINWARWDKPFTIEYDARGLTVEDINVVGTGALAWTATGIGTSKATVTIPVVNQDAYIYFEACCFVAGTKVLTSLNGETKNIEDLKENDTVVSYNTKTREFYLATVKKLIINKNTTDIAEVSFDNEEKLIMNAYHPIYTETGFHSITRHKGYEELVVGDICRTKDGWTIVTDIKHYGSEPIITYNLDVIDNDEILDNEENDTFIANGIVVHNASCPT